jgi:hypothetical protein
LINHRYEIRNKIVDFLQFLNNWWYHVFSGLHFCSRFFIIQTNFLTILFQINEENKLFQAGKAPYYEKLNANSDIPKDVFEKEKEGDVDPKDRFVRAYGDFTPDESEWYTHPELEELYASMDRQSIPASYDSTTLGKEIEEF